MADGSELNMHAGIGRWLSSRHVGASSSALAAAILGHVPEHEPSWPHDGSDFGRCVVLWHLVGAGALAGLERLAAVSGPWHRLSQHWDELLRLHDLDQEACHKLVRKLGNNGDERGGCFESRRDADGRWDRFRTTA